MGEKVHILVTGNMGYVGTVLVETIHRHQPEIIVSGLDNGYFAPCLTLAVPILPETHLRNQHFADVRNLPSSLFEGIDAVIQLAAVSNDPMGNLFSGATEAINYQATMALARQAKQAGVQRFIFASSCSVYGLAEDAPRTEQSTVNPLTPYAQSKVAAEQSLLELASPEFQVTCLRFATACGPSPRLRLDLVLNDFVTDAVLNGSIDILSDGSPWRPLIDARDMGRALLWAAVRPRAEQDFELYNAGCNDWNFQVRDLAFAVRDVFPAVRVQINQAAQPDQRSYQVDFSKFAAAAGPYAPHRKLASTIVDLASLLEASSFQENDFRNSDLVRLCYLRKLIAHQVLDQDLRWQ